MSPLVRHLLAQRRAQGLPVHVEDVVVVDLVVEAIDAVAAPKSDAA